MDALLEEQVRETASGDKLLLKNVEYDGEIDCLRVDLDRQNRQLMMEMKDRVALFWYVRTLETTDLFPQR
jgi:hypothetical protein